MGYQEEVCDLMAENGALRARVVTAENCTKAQVAEIERLTIALQASESLKAGYLDSLQQALAELTGLRTDIPRLERGVKNILDHLNEAKPRIGDATFICEALLAGSVYQQKTWEE